MTMIEIAEEPISPDQVVQRAKNDASGCVVTYVGLIRDNSHGKAVRHVEYSDHSGEAASSLDTVADEAMRRWKIERVAITHRVGQLKVGEINLVIAVAAAHRTEGFAACEFVIDQFKARVPTQKSEVYVDGTVYKPGRGDPAK